MSEFNYEVGMYIETCIVCGVNFAVPIKYRDKRRKDHKGFCCPNGHTQYYPSETDAEKLERKLNYAEGRLDRCQLNSKNLDYRARYYKGQLTKLKRQQEGGVT